MKKKMKLYHFGRALLRPIFKLVFNCKVVNPNSLPNQGKCILCCNHVSFADPIFLAINQEREINFMAKKELFKNKLFGRLISSLGAFPVDRGSGDGKAINTASNILKGDSILGIFLEGTRSKTGELLRPRAGVAMIAYQSGADVIPCCITPEKGRVKLFKKVLITFGKPIPNAELDIKSGLPSELRKASHYIMDKIAEIRTAHLKELEK